MFCLAHSGNTTVPFLTALRNHTSKKRCFHNRKQRGMLLVGAIVFITLILKVIAVLCGVQRRLITSSPRSTKTFTAPDHAS